MEEPRNTVNRQEHEEKNPVVLFFTNVLSAIKPPKKNIEPVAASPPAPAKPAVAENDTVSKPGVVTFPTQSFTPLKLEAEVEGGDRTTNPLILWQVYAIGGYYVLRWAWNKWNERKGRDEADNDEPPPTSD